MPCFTPLQGYFVHHSDGSRTVKFCNAVAKVFRANALSSDYRSMFDVVSVPCGRCIGCRLENSRQWAVRCDCESRLYEDNCFLTLTYRPEDLPLDWSLDKRVPMLFMKRLRKAFGEGIRVLYCGEYGENFGRPHYHLIIFNHDFKDKKLWKVTNGNRLYTSNELSELWPFGFSSIGNVTFDSSAYVARYVTKKITGPMADEHYNFCCPESGEYFSREPEFAQASRMRGLGYDWYQKFKSDVFPSDKMIVNGKECKPPKYFLDLLKLEDPVMYERVREKRRETADLKADDNTFDRLMVKMKLKEHYFKKLVRQCDMENAR